MCVGGSGGGREAPGGVRGGREAPPVRLQVFRGGAIYQAKGVEKAAAEAAGDAAGAAADAVDAGVVVGCKARVCSDKERNICGLQGRVAHITPAGVASLEELKSHDVFTVPVGDLKPMAHLKAALSLLPHTLTLKVKMEIVMECVWDEGRAGEDELEPRTMELAGNHPVMLVTDHVQTWWSYLKHAFAKKLKKRVFCADPQHLWSYWQAHLHGNKTAEAMGRAITRQCRDADLVLLPCWERQPDHWTLLAVDVQAEEMRYYDSLQLEHPLCRCLATGVKYMLQYDKKGKCQWMPEDIPERHNHCRQEGIDCGFYVAWWLEVGQSQWDSEGEIAKIQCPGPGRPHLSTPDSDSSRRAVNFPL